MNFKNLIALFALGVLMWSCGDDQVSVPRFRQSIQLDMDNIANYNTVRPDPAPHSGHSICHVDSGSNFGVCYVFSIPDSLVGRQISVDMNAWIRTGNLQNNCDIICSVTQGDKIKQWTGLSNKKLQAPNEWTSVSGSALVNDSLMKPDTKISIIVQNTDAKSYMDVDDLNINFSETE